MYDLALAFPHKKTEEQVYLKLKETKSAKLSHSPSWELTDQVRWYYLEPLYLDYDNTSDCSQSVCLDIIQYTREEITTGRNVVSLGLHQLGSRITTGTHLILSTDEVGEVLHRVAIRKEDSYIGYLTELLGVPFVYWPTFEDGFGHQTDRGIGADCVATIIYGQRRLGRRIPYVAPQKLYEYTYKVSDHTHVSYDTIQEGDILHFGFQTAVISKDLPPIGRLSNNDKIIHSFHKAVEEIDFSSLEYKSMPYDVLRWN